MAGWISKAGWKTGGSGRNEEGRDEAGRVSDRNASRQEQVREMKWWGRTQARWPAGVQTARGRESERAGACKTNFQLGQK